MKQAILIMGASSGSALLAIQFFSFINFENAIINNIKKFRK